MDADRFDALTRSLDSYSRRRALGTLSAIATGFLAPLLGLPDVQGKKKGGGGKGGGGGDKKKDKNECNYGFKPCGKKGKCCDTRLCCNGVCCKVDQTCSSNKLCTSCPRHSDPCKVFTCDDEGITTGERDRCASGETCDSSGRCYKPNSKCPNGFSLCRNNNTGVSVCCSPGLTCCPNAALAIRFCQLPENACQP